MQNNRTGNEINCVKIQKLMMKFSSSTGNLIIFLETLKECMDNLLKLIDSTKLFSVHKINVQKLNCMPITGVV